MMRGRVVGPEGPVAGAVVVATEATPDEPLREQPCDCGRPCELKLLSMSCRPEGLLAWLESGAGEPPPQARTTTDAEGRFTLAGLAAGQYSVWAEGPRGVGLAEGVATGSEDVEVRLGGGPSLSGRVWDELEQPVADARVTAILVAHHRSFEVSTAKDGRFQFESLPVGDYSVLVSKEGMLPEHAQPRGAAMRRLLDVRMVRSRPLSGRVVMGEAPVPGARVKCEGPQWVRETAADNEGRFTFEALRPDRYAFSATHGEAWAEERVVLVPGGAPPEVILTLGNARLLPGEVRDSRGAPIVGASVSAFLTTPPHVPRWKQATTDARGTFSLGPAALGIYSIHVEATGFLDHREDVRLAEDTAPLAIVLRDAVTVEGVVVDAEGHPVAGANLALLFASDLRGPFDASVIARDDLERESTAKSQADGSFVIAAEASGERGLVAEHDGYRSTWLPVTSPQKGLRVVLEQGATVTGEVLSETGEPVLSARVGLVPRQPEVNPSGVKRALTDAKGRFVLQGIEAGHHSLVVARTDSDTERRLATRLEVRGREPVHARLQFVAGLSLSGIVEDVEGHPLEGVLVRATPTGKAVVVGARGDDSGAHVVSYPGEASGKTDEEGRFELSQLVPGTYALMARRAGHQLDETRNRGATMSRIRQLSMPAEAGDSEVRLVMRRDEGVRGRLVREDGTPITRFQLWDATITHPQGEFFQRTYDGEEVTLRFHATGFARLSLTVSLTKGQSLDLGAVVLHPGRQVRGRVTDAATGRPVAGALVGMGDVPEDAEGWVRETRLDEEMGAVRTRQDGTFILPHVMERPYALTVTHASYSQKRLMLGAEQDEVAVALDAGALMRGTVTGLKNETATVVLSAEASGFRREVPVLSGRFEQGGLPPGAYVVAVSVDVAEEEEALPPVFVAQRVQVPDTGTVTVDFASRQDGVTLHLRVAGAGEDSMAVLAQGTVPVPSTKGDMAQLLSLYPRVLTKEGGGWTFRSQPEGTYTVFVFRRGEPHPFSCVREELMLPGTGEVTRELTPSWTPLPTMLLLSMNWY